MTDDRAAQQRRQTAIDARPASIGLLRPDVSGLDGPRHAVALRRHAEAVLGYRYIYTMRPPVDVADPVGFALNFVIGMNLTLAALVVFDLTTVDHSPARVCEVCDLETVCPPETWARARLRDPDAHGFPDHPLSVDEAARDMQLHIDCSVLRCQRKSTAYGRLVAAGRLVPQVTTAEERARERGIPVPDDAVPAGGVALLAETT
ncbi:hypothetical protein [Nocardia sp. BMG51109]|uniref:hypothetical protein n=1 Tax=Nocardia sp. BMG51109 TaxID=1056816 RepID=UPI000462F352|nr:hypothetical protein [Nocardia sp. BMG51109]